MSSKIMWTLLSSRDIKDFVPLSQKASKITQESKEELKSIFSGNSKKKVVIIWPCSADFESSLLEYAKFLKEMKTLYGDKILFIMRFYTGKPRTIGGWKGIQQWPLETSKKDISLSEGFLFIRKLGIQLIETSEIALADELLHPQYFEHFNDVFAYFAIWARSGENQYHREVSSGADMPIGMKNPTSGNLNILGNSIKAAQTASTFVIENSIYTSTGNQLSHGILRGGDSWPNFSKLHIESLLEITKKQNIKNPWVLIDCSHENCKIDGEKDPLKQIDVVNIVMKDIRDNPELMAFVKWFMIESYIYDGNQSMPESIKDAKKWLSLTDPCIGLEATRNLLKNLYEVL